MSRISRATVFRATLAGAVLVVSMSLTGCDDKSGDEPEPDATPSTEPSETIVAVDHYDCPIDGYTIPAIELGGAMDIGGNGQWYEAACFTLESPTRVDALAYPLTGDQAQTFQIFRLDPEAVSTIPTAITDWYRSDPAVGDLLGVKIGGMSGAYGYLPATSADLDPGIYLFAVIPTFDDELVSTRIAIFGDGADHRDAFLTADNPWVVEQASGNRTTCSPEGYYLLPQPIGWFDIIQAEGNEWEVRCFTLDEPTTVTVLAYPDSASQDLVMEIVSLSPSGASILPVAFDQYRTDPSAPPVTFDSVLSADDEIGVLPWGMVDLPAGEYAIIITPYEAVPLEDFWVSTASDGDDHIDFFGGSGNPFVVDQYNSYLEGGGTGD
jgi:hypothetical protein